MFRACKSDDLVAEVALQLRCNTLENQPRFLSAIVVDVKHSSLNLEPYLKRRSNGYCEKCSPVVIGAPVVACPTESKCHISDEFEFLLGNETCFQWLISNEVILGCQKFQMNWRRRPLRRTGTTAAHSAPTSPCLR